MSDSAGQILHVRVQRDDRWPPFDCEEVRGQPVGEHRYRVATAPAFAKRLSVSDVVTVSSDATGRLWIDAVVEPGRHSTIRVIALRPEVEAPLTSGLSRLGCRVSPSPLPTLLTVDVPEAVDYAEIRRFLEGGERQGDWEYQEAAVAAHHELAAWPVGM